MKDHKYKALFDKWPPFVNLKAIDQCDENNENKVENLVLSQISESKKLLDDKDVNGLVNNFLNEPKK